MIANILTQLAGGLISDEKKEEAIKEIIQDALEDAADEYGLTSEEVFLTINPKNDKFEFRIYIYQLKDRTPKMLREISLSEILGSDENG